MVTPVSPNRAAGLAGANADGRQLAHAALARTHGGGRVALQRFDVIETFGDAVAQIRARHIRAEANERALAGWQGNAVVGDRFARSIANGGNMRAAKLRAKMLHGHRSTRAFPGLSDQTRHPARAVHRPQSDRMRNFRPAFGSRLPCRTR